MSNDEIERFKRYSDLLRQGYMLNPKELKDFEELSEKIRKELPKNKREEFDLILAGFFGFLLGLGLALFLEELGKPKRTT